MLRVEKIEKSILVCSLVRRDETNESLPTEWCVRIGGREHVSVSSHGQAVGK